MKRKLLSNNENENNGNQTRLQATCPISAVSLLLAASSQQRAFLSLRGFRQQPRMCLFSITISSPIFIIAASFTEKSWACGFKNAQLLIAAALQIPSFRTSLASTFESISPQISFLPQQPYVPSIPSIQFLIERAWSLGFDPVGAAQLDSHILSTKKWIGACEIYAFFHSIGIKANTYDFRNASGPNATHPVLLDFVEAYFDSSLDEFLNTWTLEKATTPVLLSPLIWMRNTTDYIAGNFIHDTEKMPLYFQYQGHSLTIIGIEILKSGLRNLLVLDPGTKIPPKLCVGIDLYLRSSDATEKMLNVFRFGEHLLRKHPSYQIVEVVGKYDPKSDSEGRKVFRTKRLT
ncbi:hypothetical protein HK100_005389 [Physocladia obscura]|uniref:UFSP1/2/DUB catalytic domain-containing protein n=1 Tax=Physocladia obscura TaxID=109957 RepID=A0AAD5T8G7_9FUNG|nr:hypothetical protein HK100_005389 [Physocladia obscura]